MKKSLFLLAMCLSSLFTYAQDDDVYFVPSSKDRTESNDTYTTPSGRSSYTPITGEDATFESSNWAVGRGNGGRDVDAYNRRGKNYKGFAADSLGMKDIYDQAYEDGYEDGSCTARIVRFYSPRAGVYVSSPYYFDYYDLCYDPFFYGYGSAWSIGWSGWYGWGSWYGWRPYYNSYWGWHSPWYGSWYDPWYGWGGSHWAWHPVRPLPANAERGIVGGWVSRGGSRGVNGVGYANNTSGRGSSSLSGRGFGNGSTNANTSRRSFGSIFSGSNNNANSSNANRGIFSGRGFGTTNQSGSQSNRRTFGTDNSNRSNSNSRTFNNSNNSQPSRSSSNSGFSGRGFGGSNGSRGFGGGSTGGGRSFGRRR